MDDTEVIANKYLCELRYDTFAYESNGNIPPDFLLNGKIGIEVQRLNQHELTENPRGLEELQLPLAQQVTRLSKSFGPPTQGISWFVFYRFERLFPRFRTLAHRLKVALTEIDDTR